MGNTQRKSQGTLLSCEQVSEDHLADRYAMGRLTGAEAEAFEDHYMTCEVCVAELEQAELRVRGFKVIGAEAAGRVMGDEISESIVSSPPANDTSEDAEKVIRPSSPWAELSRQPSAWMALAALVLVSAGLPYLLTGMGSPTMKAGGSVGVFHLQPLRSAEGAPGHQVQMGSGSPWIILALELDPPFFPTYRATLKRRGADLWQGSDLKLGERDTVHLSLDASLLGPGDHLVVLEGERDGTWAEVGQFPFKVQDP